MPTNEEEDVVLRSVSGKFPSFWLECGRVRRICGRVFQIRRAIEIQVTWITLSWRFATLYYIGIVVIGTRRLWTQRPNLRKMEAVQIASDVINQRGRMGEHCCVPLYYKSNYKKKRRLRTPQFMFIERYTFINRWRCTIAQI